jgi:hypothetical protein
MVMMTRLEEVDMLILLIEPTLDRIELKIAVAQINEENELED